MSSLYKQMRGRSLAALLAVSSILSALPGTAQTISNTELRITSATLQDGQAGVTVRDTFEFTFSRALPFSSITNTAFYFEPRALAHREEFFFGGDRTVRFRIVHQPETDYVVYVFGALTCNDPARGQGCYSALAPASTFYLQKRPHVLNYTTAATAGTRDVSGQVTFGDLSQPPAKAGGNAALMRDLVAAAYSDLTPAGPPPLFSAAATDSLARTVVLLLDRYALSASAWRPRAGAAPDAAGAFQMNHVRDGVYWPVAVHFADRFGKTVGRYGYHDADGDFEPDPVTVSGGNVSGLNMVLMPDEPILAGVATEVARLRARSLFSDAELLTVQGLDPRTDGTAVLWRYTYYSPGRDSVVTVDASSFSTQSYLSAAPPEMAAQLPLARTFVNSDHIMQLAEAQGGAEFRAGYPDGWVTISAALGDLPLLFRPASPARFWHVLYESPPGEGEMRSLELFFDAETGARLQGQPVSTERLDEIPMLVLSEPSPHPVRSQMKITYTLRSSGMARLSLFDVLGRRVAQLSDAVQPAGTHSVTWDASAIAAGTYFLRLEAEGHVVQQPIVVAR